MTRLLWIGLASLAAALLAPAGTADANDLDTEGTWNFTWENDFFAGTDRNYTNGVRLSFRSGERQRDAYSGWLTRRMLQTSPSDRYRYGFSLGHSIYTPVDTELTIPLPDQHPYAGWLYGEYSLQRRWSGGLDELIVQLGIVGEAAGGEWVQNNVHDLVNGEQVEGWDNQLDNEPGLLIAFDRRFRRIRDLSKVEALGFGMDVTPNLGVAVGNVLTQASAGLTLRLGQDLPDDFGPARVRPALSGGGFFNPASRFGWYAFAGVEGRAVAQNIFLDGNTFSDSQSVDKFPLVADFQVGLALQMGDMQLAYTYVTRSEEFKTQRERQRFGAVSLSLKF
ncbi:MAG: lipid A deacylase LpxR family protein [Pseudomonadota bacterium]